MNEEIIFGLAGMVFVLILIALAVVVFGTLMKVRQAKIETEREELYQKLSQDSIEVQKGSVQYQEQLASEMADVKERLASIEQILKEVE